MSVLQQGRGQLLKTKQQLLNLLQASPKQSKFEFPRPGRKTIIRSRADLESEIVSIDVELKERKKFDTKFKEAMPLTHPGHFYLAYKETINELAQRPKRSQAGKASGENKQKNADTWQQEF